MDLVQSGNKDGEINLQTSCFDLYLFSFGSVGRNTLAGNFKEKNVSKLLLAQLSVNLIVDLLGLCVFKFVFFL